MPTAFNGIAMHLANHDVMAPRGIPRAACELQAFNSGMGWTFPGVFAEWRISTTTFQTSPITEERSATAA